MTCPDGAGGAVRVDLVGGRVFDPGTDLDSAATVSIDDDLISGVREPAAGRLADTPRNVR